jgi:hypothetical protein
MSRSLFGTAVSRWVPSSGGIGHISTVSRPLRNLISIHISTSLSDLLGMFYSHHLKRGQVINSSALAANIHYFKMLEIPRSRKFTLILHSAQNRSFSFGLKLRDRYIRRFQIEVRPNEISTVEEIKRRTKDEQTRVANLEARLAKAENTRTSTRKLQISAGSGGRDLRIIVGKGGEDCYLVDY